MIGVARQDFEARASEVRAARRFAAAEASGWGLKSNELESVVGELAANAYVHAGTPFSVSLLYRDQSLSVEVSDRSTSLPTADRVQHASALTTGRGLLMVECIAASWGARSTRGGKIVWAELAAVPLAI